MMLHGFEPCLSNAGLEPAALAASFRQVTYLGQHQNLVGWVGIEPTTQNYYPLYHDTFGSRPYCVSELPSPYLVFGA